MPDAGCNPDFQFERWLRFLLPYLSEEPTTLLKQWISNLRTYDAARKRVDAIGNGESLQNLQEKIDHMLAVEATINDVVATVFLETPDPEEAVGLWDGGKTRSNLAQRENVINEIGKLISLAYTRIRDDAALFDREQGARVESGKVCAEKAVPASVGPTQVTVSTGEADKPEVKEAFSGYGGDRARTSGSTANKSPPKPASDYYDDLFVEDYY
ncbi:hypothetical protein FKG94_14685 [Exilibacterium tricleocarpae]|uniref:Uncharacterized protein n=1 Tax=Exilibacterium tricleocarpae TaxID=2591008 RepID=A0A545TK81_9GAMM|nr:hypothetical protein [Exilibacterium tricleocarpae]TQV77617.1 hypothetical protein FKG94_14685 [Exilibacterium tricleocarpae]